MNLNLLRTFICVVEERNYSRAAARLHLSQPAVSMQMQSLAQELGVELLRRTGHRIEVTEAGELVYKQARELLHRWQHTLDQLEGLRQKLQGRLHLGASTVPGDYLLPPLLCDFYRLHPDLEVRLKVAASREIVRELVAGRLDLAVVGYKPEQDNVECRVVASDQLVAVFSPDHPLRHRSSVTAKELFNHPLLQRSPGSATRQVLEQALAKAGYPTHKPLVAMELGSSRALLEAAARGMGVAVVSRLAAEDYIHQGRLDWRPFRDLELKRSFWLAWLSKPLPGVARAFIDFIERSVKNG